MFWKSYTTLTPKLKKKNQRGNKDAEDEERWLRAIEVERPSRDKEDRQKED